MLTVAVLYPAEASFDHAYYAATHMPMVHRLWGPLGLSEAKVMRGVPGPDGSKPAYGVMTLLSFPDMHAFTQAAGQHGAEIMGDVKNFTPGTPVVQFNEV